MATPKQLPQQSHLKSQDCKASKSGQHRFQGFPYSTQRCTWCNRLREEVYGDYGDNKATE